MFIERLKDTTQKESLSKQHAANVNQPDEILVSAYKYPANTVLTALCVDASYGLSDKEAAERLKRDGLNIFETSRAQSLWLLFFGQFKSIVIWLLGAASVIAWFTNSRLEAAAILIVLVINAIIGFAIEWQAGRALYALRKAVQTFARAKRQGREALINSSGLVCGDIIILTAGDRVPADARLVEAANVMVDESTLTGESVPVEKAISAVKADSALAERHSMIYLGTTIVAGRAVAAVTSVGSRTEIGRIGQLLGEVKSEQTPLERKLKELGAKLVYIVLGIAALMMLVGFLRGDDWLQMLKISISLAVAAVPEGLPAVTTLILALGVLKMARRNAIVRKLSAVETLGSTTVICTDKTGTLTENRMVVQEYELSNGRKIRLADHAKPNLRDGNLQRLLRASVLCNEASLEVSSEKERQAIGDPTETALLVAAAQFGVETKTERQNSKKIFEIPFDTVAKRMIAVSEDDRGNRISFMKGAPAVVIDACDTYLNIGGQAEALTAEIRQEFLKINEQMADRSLRVLAYAEKPLTRETKHDLNYETQDGYIFLGFSGMTDPLREGVIDAVIAARRAGIQVVMLTGDQLNTARAIAAELKINGEQKVCALHSDNLIGSSNAEITEIVNRTQVFARVTPEDKLRIVEALQKAGNVVAVTGDGVNDAPALKRADIGIAMGKNGTEVAKEAANIVLTDDNFSTLVSAIEGGRTIYANITKFVQMMFSHNLGEILVVFIPIAAGLSLPLLPVQILWVNLVTDVFPALALAVEPPAPEVMQQRPLDAQKSLLSPPFLLLIVWQGIMLGTVTLIAYLWALQAYDDGAHARTIVLLSVVGAQLGHLYNCRSRTRSAFDGFFRNPYIFAASVIVIWLQLLAVYWSPLVRVLDTVAPNKIDLAVFALSVIIPVVIVEIVKLFTRKLKKLNSQ